MQGGIDEAGRGPVLGPLVVAGVAVEDPRLLKQLGCRDSKALSPGKREAIDRQLRANPDVRIEVRTIPAEVLDAERQRWTLNEIEVERFRDIARCLDAKVLYVDAADVDAARFGKAVGRGLPGTKVVSEHKADDTYPVVGAASIVAKVARDAAIAELARRLERKLEMPLGSGYASDPFTQSFLRTWHERFGDLPEGTRRSWATIKEMLAPRKATLDEFAPAATPLATVPLDD